jgi:hypothetical protein
MPKRERISDHYPLLNFVKIGMWGLERSVPVPYFCKILWQRYGGSRCFFMMTKHKSKTVAKWSEQDLKTAAIGFIISGSLEGAASISGISKNSLRSLRSRSPERWERALKDARESIQRPVNESEIDALGLMKATIESITLIAGQSLPGLLNSLSSSKPTSARGKKSQLDSILKVWNAGSSQLLRLKEIEEQGGGGKEWEAFQRNIANGILQILEKLAMINPESADSFRSGALDMNCLLEVEVQPPVFEKNEMIEPARFNIIGKA